MDGSSKQPRSKRPDGGWKDPLWERQDGEPTKAFDYFATYRDLGPARSMTIAANALSKHTATLQAMSITWGWVERTQAWDDEADRNQRKRDAEERAQARSQMLREHQSAGKALIAVGAAALQQYDKNHEGAAQRIKDLTARDAAALIETGAKMERLARGESTERLEVREALDWVEGFIELALGYLPRESHDAFLSDVDAKMGMGGTV